MNAQSVQPTRGRIDGSKLALGLFLVALGLTFLFDRLDWWDHHELFRLWPLWLIAFGVLRVAFPRHRRSRIAGFWPILIGTLFLLDSLDVMGIGESWPLFVVGSGILMMLRAAGAGRCEHGRAERTGA